MEVQKAIDMLRRIDCSHADARAAADILERLSSDVPKGHIRDEDGETRRVLGKLSVTADGCVIGAGADLFYWWIPQYTDDDGTVQHKVTNGIVCAPHLCYSTRNAAEAAGK